MAKRWYFGSRTGSGMPVPSGRSAPSEHRLTVAGRAGFDQRHAIVLDRPTPDSVGLGAKVDRLLAATFELDEVGAGHVALEPPLAVVLGPLVDLRLRRRSQPRPAADHRRQEHWPVVLPELKVERCALRERWITGRRGTVPRYGVRGWNAGEHVDAAAESERSRGGRHSRHT